VRYKDVPPFFKYAKYLKNEAKQKPRFLLCVLKKATDGLFQQSIGGGDEKLVFQRPVATASELFLY